MLEMLLMCLVDKKTIEEKENNREYTDINVFVFNHLNEKDYKCWFIL